MFDILPGRPVGDFPRTGDTLPLSAGIREVHPLLLGLIENRLVVRQLDCLALLGELDLEVLDLVVRNVSWAVGCLLALFEFAALLAGSATLDSDRAATAAERAVHRFGERGLGHCRRPPFEEFLRHVGI